jgi:hypothetical protein
MPTQKTEQNIAKQKRGRRSPILLLLRIMSMKRVGNQCRTKA